MQNLNLKVSIVIPAYNEESHIADCLNAISKLNKTPFEVIVVDNNSTDDTAKIVEQFSFAKLVHEKRQGVVYARDCGFDLAKGNIIARIDADTLLPANWAGLVDRIFDDSKVQAVSGSFHFYDIGMSRILDTVEGYLRGWMARRMTKSERIFLNASNMAIRKSAWLKVRDHVCRVSGSHEDLDLALHMAEANLKVIYQAELKADVSARRIDSNFISLVMYALISPRTYRKHGAIEYIYMYPEIAIVLFFYPVLILAFKAYDMNNQKLSIRQLRLSRPATRVNPADIA
jgi:glycosyltransferase involved in cell wall biosynthesis